MCDGSPVVCTVLASDSKTKIRSKTTIGVNAFCNWSSQCARFSTFQLSFSFWFTYYILVCICLLNFILVRCSSLYYNSMFTILCILPCTCCRLLAHFGSVRIASVRLVFVLNTTNRTSKLPMFQCILCS